MLTCILHNIYIHTLYSTPSHIHFREFLNLPHSIKIPCLWLSCFSVGVWKTSGVVMETTKSIFQTFWCLFTTLLCRFFFFIVITCRAQKLSVVIFRSILTEAHRKYDPKDLKNENTHRHLRRRFKIEDGLKKLHSQRQHCIQLNGNISI